MCAFYAVEVYIFAECIHSFPVCAVEIMIRVSDNDNTACFVNDLGYTFGGRKFRTDIIMSRIRPDRITPFLNSRNDAFLNQILRLQFMFGIRIPLKINDFFIMMLNVTFHLREAQHRLRRMRNIITKYIICAIGATSFICVRVNEK